MTPRQIHAEPLGPYRAALGEGPLWNARTGRLLWLDILSQRLLETDPNDGASKITAFAERVSAIAHRAGGGLLAAAGSRLCTLGDEGSLQTIVTLPAEAHGNLNDGKADARGRFWCGTASFEAGGHSSLYRFDNGAPPVAVLGGVSMSNGIGWSPDNSRLYYVDSPTRRLDAFAFDLDSGEVRARAPLIELPEGQLPDGLCVDAEGCIWLAVWGGSHVLRITPDGAIDAEIRIPTAAVSSCAFGGSDGRTLFITTAQEGMTAEQLAADPWAGALFAADVGVTGSAVATTRL
ncbi:MAG: SMP-30/gluconolactonase/LRE family protein [Hyphomicrobiales bacterium]|nr:MAG: SMP-30/gluconolactonase/LRE family protein [Hyphomicrobiales bacterium]